MTDINQKNGTNLSPIEAKIKEFGYAIALAEGYFASANKVTGKLPLPKRANNPGDLKMGDKGHGTIGGKTIYASESDGWVALDHQVSLMLLGGSHQYERGMTIEQVAQHWTGSDHAESWAETVAEHCGIAVTTTLYQYIQS